jgi:hypothetical protein
MSHYCDSMDFSPNAPLVQMHMVINIFLIMIINNGFLTNNFIINTSILLFFEK